MPHSPVRDRSIATSAITQCKNNSLSPTATPLTEVITSAAISARTIALLPRVNAAIVVFAKTVAVVCTRLFMVTPVQYTSIPLRKSPFTTSSRQYPHSHWQPPDAICAAFTVRIGAYPRCHQRRRRTSTSRQRKSSGTLRNTMCL